MRIVFMGTPDFAASALQKLIEHKKIPVGVVTQPARAVGRGLKTQPSEVETVAQEHGIPVLAVESVNTPEALAQLRVWNPDLILVAAFGQLLKNDVLTLPRFGCLNVHGSLLPKYRGAAPIQRAILEGEKETGITIQRMVRKLDAGDILLMRTVPIGAKETSGELFARLAKLGGACLVDAVNSVEANTAVYLPQDEARATHAAKLSKAEAIIDWHKTATEIERAIRAFQPWPVAETRLGGERLKIFSAEVLPQNLPHPPGTLVSDSKSLLHVACGVGTALALTQIQLENRKKLETREFLMAYRGNFPFSSFDSGR